MKAVILAGGFGTRLAEETTARPKPMVEIGGRPILWHIMKIFEAGGVNEFVIALGYKGEVIKDYFLNFYAINNDITVDLSTGDATIHDGNQPQWKVHLVDTGLNTMTGGRLRRLKPWLADGEPFFFTYGDGVADVDLRKLAAFHRAHGKVATVTTVRPPARFGNLTFDEDRVVNFHEKPEEGEGWINGGFFVLNPQAIDYIDADATVWEREPVDRMVRDGQLRGYRHFGFWSCMDTLKEKEMLEEMWASGDARWKVWNDGQLREPVAAG
ncbi:MAG TPA: glucose-1-phosphate cytidylyltransferase [Trueperaceae bacterium]|nr:glucose-1-phosphate cytidylyltransferase [Trueperaceae bacterium]